MSALISQIFFVVHISVYCANGEYHIHLCVNNHCIRIRINPCDGAFCNRAANPYGYYENKMDALRRQIYAWLKSVNVHLIWPYLVLNLFIVCKNVFLHMRKKKKWEKCEERNEQSTCLCVYILAEHYDKCSCRSCSFVRHPRPSMHILFDSAWFWLPYAVLEAAGMANGQ